MTKVESLNPLRTLHNSVPLKEMDGFFDKTAGEGAETLVTPINTPSRKPPSRRLAARSAPNPVQSAEKKSSAGSEPDTEGVTDLLTEAIQKLDSWQEFFTIFKIVHSVIAKLYNKRAHRTFSLFTHVASIYANLLEQKKVFS